MILSDAAAFPGRADGQTCVHHENGKQSVGDWWLVVHQDLQSVPRIRAVIAFITATMRRDHDVLMS